MKQDDFERLKAICEKEGFEVRRLNPDVFQVNKKDPWEGVEFVTFQGTEKVWKVIGLRDGKILVQDPTQGAFITKDIAKPSTETAYVEQLEKEAFERFGEIKEGDRFKNNPSKGVHTFKIDHGVGFRYGKEEDMLTFNGWPIYQQGKWAERVKERVKVESMLIIRNGDSELHEFTFKSSKRDIPLSAGEFLASQLEKYLNGEID